MTSHELDAYYGFALKLVQDAAEVLKKVTSGMKAFNEKLGAWDLVTEHDKRIEDIIIGRLKREYPKHKFIAEESVGPQLPELTDDPTWIIDPIDGTMNFIHNFPHICIVVGLSIRKEMVIGIVYNPMLEQLFTAKKGQGAFLNGQPIKASKIQDISKALVCMEPAFMKIDYLKDYMLERFQALIENAHGLRALGVAALTLCYVALGAIEAYHIEGPAISTWDIAAASLIITEAGGVVIDRVTGEKVNLMNPRAIGACNEKIAIQLRNIIREADRRVDSRKK
ncbi:inositol monophosphatase 2 [Orussus abietinus]|uniref:inositol monophosphatase 2 n=1 Tax=Orussus abietinus TaxID=222816 RepID=UPI0006252F14|nr:inositol monophosphatase 2 [Orussus abietinus]